MGHCQSLKNFLKSMQSVSHFTRGTNLPCQFLGKCRKKFEMKNAFKFQPVLTVGSTVISPIITVRCTTLSCSIFKNSCPNIDPQFSVSKITHTSSLSLSLNYQCKFYIRRERESRRQNSRALTFPSKREIWIKIWFLNAIVLCLHLVKLNYVSLGKFLKKKEIASS